MIDILIVDHAAENVRSVRNLLSEVVVTGFRLHFVTDYREILLGFRSKAYNICLIDSATGNGLRLFTQARSLGCETPVILVTSNDARDVIRAFRSGVADCLTRQHMTPSTIESSICCVAEEAGISLMRVERERRYLALMDNTGETICTHDLEGKLTSISRSGELSIGYSQEVSLNLSVTQLVAPDFHDVVEQMIKQTLDSQRQTSYQIEILNKNGHTFPVEVETHPIYQDGRVVEVQWIVRQPRTQAQTGTSTVQNLRFNLTSKSVNPLRLLRSKSMSAVA
ncbi:MAG: PAS domain S-box protein [Pyrinomonadaceae bacterium]